MAVAKYGPLVKHLIRRVFSYSPTRARALLGPWGCAVPGRGRGGALLYSNGVGRYVGLLDAHRAVIGHACGAEGDVACVREVGYFVARGSRGHLLGCSLPRGGR